MSWAREGVGKQEEGLREEGWRMEGGWDCARAGWLELDIGLRARRRLDSLV